MNKKILEIDNINGGELHERFDRLESKFTDILSWIKRNPETKLLTRKQVCEMLGISLVTLSAWCDRGVIPSYKVGNSVRFKESEVLESLKERALK